MKTIGIIALSGEVDKNKLELAVINLENLGFNVVLSKNIFDKKRYLAGDDDTKLKALYDFVQNPDIDLIMSARGGYGLIRLVNKIDYSIIKNNPKPFVGFSDFTALLLLIYKNTGMITYHGPMVCSDFGCEVLTDPHPNPPRWRGEESAPTPVLPQKGGDDISFTYRNFLKALNGEQLNFQGNKIYKEGSANGIIWGGNLATVASLCGLDFIPNEDFIFFAEDLNEPVYKIDKMFTQLFNIETFRKYCKGIVLGDFLDVDNQKWLEELFHEFPVPTVGGFKITHNNEKITIPIGAKAVLSDQTLIISHGSI